MKPVVFLSFANHQDDHLPMLEKEVENIENKLQFYHDKGYLEIYKTESLNPSILAVQSNRFADRILIFHYGGHAGSKNLLIKNGKGDAEGIAQLLTSNPKKAPKLVFLNGCSTKEQVQYFFKHGVKAVIATSVPINDHKAVDFAEQFYGFLANDFKLKQAFQKTTAFFKAKYGDFQIPEIINYRSFVFDEVKAVMPWGLYYNDDSILTWKLPKTNKNRLVLIALAAIILVGIIGMGWYQNNLSKQPFNLKVNVFGEEGKHDLVLKEQGQVVLKLPDGYEPLKQKINENGEAMFTKIDAELLGKSIPIFIEHNQPYQSLQPDSLYVLNRDATIDLTVKLNNLHQLTGKIIDFNTEQPLEDVRVSIHPKVFTFTNDFGEFILEIPEDYQQKFQEVTLNKKGYKSETFSKVPIHTQDRFNTSLEK